MTDEQWMRKALLLAAEAQQEGEVPVGAVIVRDGLLVGQGYNRPIGLYDPSAHAEMVAIRQACKASGNYRLSNTTLYVTLEPCPMCAGALVHARVRRVVFGAPDPRAGAAGSVMDILRNDTLNHRCDVTSGVLQSECAEMLKNFFRARRSATEIAPSPSRRGQG